MEPEFLMKSTVRTLLLLAAALAFPEITHAQEEGDQLAANESNFEDVADEIEIQMRRYHFDAKLEQDPAYAVITARVRELARTAGNREAFVDGFNRLWRDGPFSHVRLSIARSSAEQTAAYLDNLQVGRDQVSLEWRDRIAVLRVNTMMGTDTIEAIDAAFKDIADGNARGLIIDLRENDGGAFAVRPLVSHIVDEPLDSGAFVSRRWTTVNQGYPVPELVATRPPWDGWSIRAFWADLQSQDFLRIQFTPQSPGFDGKVYVLTSHRTASAAELAADALAAQEGVTLVGESTAGEMLSQSIFDLPRGLQLALPVGDYVSFRSGRIEGRGVTPEIQVPAADALNVALEHLGG